MRDPVHSPLKAELIRQLCDELLANHDRVTRLNRMLRQQLLPATGQTITTITGISTTLAVAIIGETGSITRFRSPAAFLFRGDRNAHQGDRQEADLLERPESGEAAIIADGRNAALPAFRFHHHKATQR